MNGARPVDPPVRIDLDNEWAWCGERRLQLTPRAFAVLRHLVEHAHRLVTKDDLLVTVWRDAIVSDAGSRTFAELDARAENVAAALSPFLTGADQVVAVAMSQDNWQIVAAQDYLAPARR